MSRIKKGALIPTRENNQAFQEGGVIDEDQLFADLDGGEQGGDLDGEPAPIVSDNPEITDLGNQQPSGLDTAVVLEDEPDIVAPLDTPPPVPDVELSGIEQFLTGYGVQGGIITYEDGSSHRFDTLDASEQANILSSLVQNNASTVEEQYSLEDTEVDLLNQVRESGGDVNNFINNLVNHRVQALSAQRQVLGEDFNTMDSDTIFVKHYIANNPSATDEQIADELVKARELSSFEATTDTIRDSMISAQKYEVLKNRSRETAIFDDELEAQRGLVVSEIEDITDIAGARVTDSMKEFLLHDIMELNENKDPILMEKIFSSPKAMFEASWWNNYGKDYITNLNAYYKKEISKARKAGYADATEGMPGSPTIVAGGLKPVKTPENGNPEVHFGREMTEEELFDLENEQ